MSYWKHDTAIVDEGAEIGEGTKVWHWTHISGQSVKIGSGCSFGQNCYVGNHVQIGNNCRVQNNVSVYDKVVLEDDVFCGPSMVFTNVVNPRAHVPRKDEYKTTLVRKGATIGANATIVCGVEIGEYAFIAAGAVVTKNVPAYALVTGVPGRLNGWMCQCGVKLNILSSETKCAACGTGYKLLSKSILARV